MLKTFVTLMRGAAATAEEAMADRNGLLILDQQLRDAGGAIERGKRALALAIAQDEAEGRRLEATLARLADLESRAVAALAAGREELAAEAAESIAALEADRDAMRTARATFGREIARLRAGVVGATARFAELERGRRIARAAEAVRRLQAGPDSGGLGTAALREAEATLKRLRERQGEDEAVDQALQALDAEGAAAGIADRLEAAGFGPRTRPSAAAVLERLRRQAHAAGAPS